MIGSDRVNGRSLVIGVGVSLLFDGAVVRILEFDGRSVTLRMADGRYRCVELAELVARGRSLEPDEWEDPDKSSEVSEDPGLVLAGLDAEQMREVRRRAEHVREALTGYVAGHAGGARPGEPRAAFAPGVGLKARYAAKASELSVTARTVEKWVAAYRGAGEAGLVDSRHRRGLRTSVDPRWDAAVRAEMAEGVAASTPTRGAVLLRAEDRLEREYGPSVVPVPSPATAYRRLAQLSKGTNAVSGSASGRRSIAERPEGVFGRLRATRPGEYIILDTQDLDAFAMEAVTCRWVGAQLTVAQDLFDRQILGMRVTPVSTKAVDVAAVLFEAFSGRGPGHRLGALHGLPDHLVFTESLPAAASPIETWCPPETLVIDRGSAFLSAHVIGVCARLGTSIQPAQPRKPTDKPTVERFFRTLRQGLIQHLPAYKGPDIYSRGSNIEGQAFLFLHELEDVIRDWITTVYHTRAHGGLAIPEWPRMELSPNDMFAAGVAKSGRLRLMSSPELVFEFLRVSWRTIQSSGVQVGRLHYNGDALDDYRNETSDYGGVHAGKWPIRVNDNDVRYVYFQDPKKKTWHRLDWEHAPMLNTPFSAEAAKVARRLALHGDRLVDPAYALKKLLERWSVGDVVDRRERRIAARLNAERVGFFALAGGDEVTDPLEDAAEVAPANDDREEGPTRSLDGIPDDGVGGAVGDDDEETEIFDNIDGDEGDGGFYDNALEVLR